MEAEKILHKILNGGYNELKDLLATSSITKEQWEVGVCSKKEGIAALFLASPSFVPDLKLMRRILTKSKEHSLVTLIQREDFHTLPLDVKKLEGLILNRKIPNILIERIFNHPGFNPSENFEMSLKLQIEKCGVLNLASPFLWQEVAMRKNKTRWQAHRELTVLRGKVKSILPKRTKVL